jgi:hypothetical protein
MMKNLFLLGLLTWVSMTYAKPVVVHETVSEADSYKVEKAEPEHSAKRSVAGSKIKKKPSDAKTEEKVETTDSEVRYWQYSEE